MSLIDLFIPTYNRPFFLRRILTFYSIYKFKHRIIIADSSTNQNKQHNKKIISEFNNLNILYVDTFSPKQVSHHKFGEMVKLAKAKYSVFCADDDFLIPEGIDEAVKFLEKNPDYSSAHGTYIAFYIYRFFKFKKFLWRFIYSIQTINETSALNRLTYHLANYNQVLWAVRRTDRLKIIYSEFLKSKADSVYFGELLPDMLSVIYGKVKRINTFYSARQAFSTAYKYWPSLQDGIKSGIYQSEYGKFKKTLIRNLKKVSKIDLKQANEEIDKAMDSYLSLSNQEHLTGRLNLLLGNFPVSIGNTIRQLHVGYLYSKKNLNKIGKIDSPFSKYFRDFINIKNLVLKDYD